MSCPHAQTTTLLWLHGELEPEHDHAAHVAECAECTAVIEAEEQVLSAIAPVADAFVARPAAPMPAPANRPAWLPWVAAALAAVALLAIGTQLSSPTASTPEPHDTDLAVVAPAPSAVELPPFGELDAGLEDLDLELAELSLEMETL